MSMERLTSSIDYCQLHCDFGKEKDCIFQDKTKCYEKNMYEKLRSYEDAEEQGLLLKLPCKIGSTVYTIHSVSSNRHVMCEIDNVDKFLLMLSVAEERFGKNVFLTKVEAEQALKRMKGE